MLENGSLRNCCDPGGRVRFGLAEREEEEAAAGGAPRPAWVVTALSSVLIFTTVVDILGNLLVIVSVFKNRKLRNAGRRQLVSDPGLPAEHQAHCCAHLPSTERFMSHFSARWRRLKAPSTGMGAPGEWSRL
uniref:Uncharacterized protein n=1 Tax=Melopsittacus undulatus TaxID=13146 RepID=A0A8V5FRR3_MELUD